MNTQVNALIATLIDNQNAIVVDQKTLQAQQEREAARQENERRMNCLFEAFRL